MWRSKEKLCYHFDYESERRIHHYVQTDMLGSLHQGEGIGYLCFPYPRLLVMLSSMLEETDSQSDLYTNGFPSQLRLLTTQRNTR